MVIGGYFNAAHTMWGYRNDTKKETVLLEAMVKNDMHLINESNGTMTVAFHTRRDGTPDLT